MTARDMILLAIADCSREAGVPLSDIVLAAWSRDPDRFGLSGHTADHPSDSRVKVDLMNRKPGNLIGSGLVARTAPNVYALTPLGRAEVARLGVAKPPAPGEPLSHYDVAAALLAMPAFVAWHNDPDRPKRWDGEPDLFHAEMCVRAAMVWCDQRDIAYLTAEPPKGGSHGGKWREPIHYTKLAELLDFVAAMRRRFKLVRAS